MQNVARLSNYCTIIAQLRLSKADKILAILFLTHYRNMRLNIFLEYLYLLLECSNRTSNKSTI